MAGEGEGYVAVGAAGRDGFVGEGDVHGGAGRSLGAQGGCEAVAGEFVGGVPAGDGGAVGGELGGSPMPAKRSPATFTARPSSSTWTFFRRWR
ncbi:hypothetical protein GCM10020256_40580 [Streptomyces thermocoprophilus]